MQLLYTDETNLDPAKAEFFVYAGVVVPSSHALQLSGEIDGLRQKYGYGPLDELKFTSNGRPGAVSVEAHANIKREVLEAASRHEVKLISSLILHAVAKSPEDARLYEINRVCLHFNYYLERLNECGIVLIDNFKGPKLADFLREKFGIGLKGLPYSNSLRLSKIVGIHLSHIGFSHFCSVIDIAVGALRYAINERSNPEKTDTVKALLGQLAPLFIWHANGKIEEISLFFSPKTIRVRTYLGKYLALHRFLASASLEAAQVPTDVRTY